MSKMQGEGRDNETPPEWFLVSTCRDVLLRDVWEYNFVEDTRTVDTHLTPAARQDGKAGEGGGGANRPPPLNKIDHAGDLR